MRHVAIEHTHDPDTGEVGLNNGGSTRTSRALAMVQIAVLDAANAFTFEYAPYNAVGLAPEGVY